MQNLRADNHDGNPAETPVFVLPPNRKEAASNKKVEKKYIAGLYCRLSRDDGRHKLVSSSIETQKDILNEYAKHIEVEVRDTYVDDGYSGTNFDRPDWKRMIKDIDSGKINMIIAKDLSRIAREAIEFGLFLEEYCTKRNVRLIAVMDGVDTIGNSNRQIIDMINMYNGWYPQDVSNKTRLAKASKARQGKFIGNYPTFGYVKNPADKNHLLPSEDAGHVTEIFLRTSKGETARQIADDFTNRGIMTPSMRINNMNGEYKRRVPESSAWNTGTITNILNNLAYIGHMEQNKRQKVSYKSKERRVVPAEERIIVYNTHEPIIPLELWNDVQNLRKSRPKVQKMKSTGVNLFSGFVRCADCGRSLAPDNIKKHLRCSKYNNGGPSACSSHTIQQNTLYEIVLAELKQDAVLAESESELLCKKLYEDITSEQHASVTENKRKLQGLCQQKENVMRRMQQAFESKNDNNMDKDVYEMMMSEYKTEKESLDEKITVLKIMLEVSDDTEEKISEWMNRIKQCFEISELSREILSELIDKIIVHQRKKVDGVLYQQVEIHYRFIGNTLNMEKTA